VVSGLNIQHWVDVRHGRMGHLFQGRFKAVPVEYGVWSYETSLYVHLNPLNIAAIGGGRWCFDWRGSTVV